MGKVQGRISMSGVMILHGVKASHERCLYRRPASWHYEARCGDERVC